MHRSGETLDKSDGKQNVAALLDITMYYWNIVEASRKHEITSIKTANAFHE